MKKKNIEQVHSHRYINAHSSLKTTQKPLKSRKSFKDLFQLNYQNLAKTVNYTLQKPYYETIITKIQLRQPSLQMIAFRQIQKNLVFQQYLTKYHRLDKFQLLIQSLIPKHLPHVKANYMDFKIKNYLILNKYKVNDKAHLPYPLSTKFEKLTDSKMSSTKSVENKVLHELDKQLKTNSKTKRNNNQLKSSKSKKNTKSKPINTQRFEIKKLTKSIGEMIQNIKDVRALQNFKKQMEKTSQFKFGLTNFQQKQTKINKKTELKEILKFPRKSTDNEIKEKQFKKKVQDQMGKNFPQDKNCLGLKAKRLSKELDPGIIFSKQGKDKFHFKSVQRLFTNPDPEIEQYGLSVIRQKRKNSKSKDYKSKSKSRDHSKRSKQSNQQYPQKSIRLQTEYSEGNTLRITTGYQTLTKSKSSSRIPTQYDSTVIIKKSKSKSKNKDEGFTFANLNTKQLAALSKKDLSTLNKKVLKSKSISQQNGLGFMKSKSKSKTNLLQFNSPNKIPKK